MTACSGLATAAVGPPSQVRMKSLNGICGWLAKVVVTWPVEGLVLTVPTSFWSMPLGRGGRVHVEARRPAVRLGSAGAQGVALELPSQPR